jgi:hypothetical protein
MGDARSTSDHGSHRRRTAAAERAELLFFVYTELGGDRSLSQLHDRLRTVGVSVSLSTLKRYSSSQGWPERIAALDEQAARRREGGHLKQALSLFDRQAQIARALQGAGGSALQQLIADNGRLRDLKPAEIARLLELGMHAEREASGGASDRRRLALSMANLVTQEVVALFERVNSITNEGSRARAFAAGLDDLVDEHLRAEEDS